METYELPPKSGKFYKLNSKKITFAEELEKISIRHPLSSNQSTGYRLLGNILGHFNAPPDRRTRVRYQLLCKSVFSSYNVNTNEIDANILEEFYHQNGLPKSLDDDVVRMKHEKWDGIESITILCDGHLNSKKIICFSKYNNTRQIKFVMRLR